MGTSKNELFTPRQNDLAKIAKALGHPARIAILDHLRKADSCVCGDLVDTIGLAQSTTSQHLKALKEAKLIKGTVEGASVCYCIDKSNWDKFSTELSAFFSYSPLLDDSCC